MEIYSLKHVNSLSSTSTLPEYKIWCYEYNKVINNNLVLNKKLYIRQHNDKNTLIYKYKPNKIEGLVNYYNLIIIVDYNDTLNFEQKQTQPQLQTQNVNSNITQQTGKYKNLNTIKIRFIHSENVINTSIENNFLKNSNNILTWDKNTLSYTNIDGNDIESKILNGKKQFVFENGKILEIFI